MPPNLEGAIDTLRGVEANLVTSEKQGAKLLEALRVRTGAAKQRLDAIASEVDEIMTEFTAVQAAASAVEATGTTLVRSRAHLAEIDGRLAEKFDTDLAAVAMMFTKLGGAMARSAATVMLSCQNLSYQIEYLTTSSQKLSESSTITGNDLHDRVDPLVRAITVKRGELADALARPVDTAE